MFDVDDFKSTNDRHGHPYGDVSLRVIAENIKASFGKIGLCYRIGGDEFCVLSEQTGNSALKNAEELFVAKMEASRRQDPNLPYVSFGRALYDQTQNGIEQVTAEADRRMFQNKQKQKLARLRSQPANSGQ
jgi:diguanylate cyclase (GGDEF)-like protein